MYGTLGRTTLRNRLRAALTLPLLALALTGAASCPGTAAAGRPPAQPRVGDVQLVSANVIGQPGSDVSSGEGWVAWSPDGSRIAFWSVASNLVPGKVGTPQVIVKHLRAGTVALVSSTRTGRPGNGGSGAPTWSPDGTRIAFSSSASNLVPGTARNTLQVFVKRLRTGAVTLASSARNGEPGRGDSYLQTWSPDDSRVAFVSEAPNVVPGAARRSPQLAVKDLRSGAITLVSSTPVGRPGDGRSGPGAWSPDGTRIAFWSHAPNLVPGASRRTAQVVVKDLRTSAVVLVSSTAGGRPGNGGSGAPVWSPDGTRIAFSSSAPNLVPGVRGSAAQVVVKDLRTGAVALVSSTEGGRPGNADSGAPAWSPDGTRIAFSSSASNLAPGAAERRRQVLAKDLRTGAVALVSSTDDGRPGDGASGFAAWSPDGSRIAFVSVASNLVPGAAGGQVYVKVVGR